jgi:hypothetical protein
VGTWSIEKSETDLDYLEGIYVTRYYKTVFTFETNGNISIQDYESTNPNDYGSPVEDFSATYTYSDGTLTITPSGETSETGKVAVYSNVLIIGDETSATAFAFIKQ